MQNQSYLNMVCLFQRETVKTPQLACGATKKTEANMMENYWAINRADDDFFDFGVEEEDFEQVDNWIWEGF